jgi:hypothetical protein
LSSVENGVEIQRSETETETETDSSKQTKRGGHPPKVKD